jgi:hypothetical protein
MPLLTFVIVLAVLSLAMVYAMVQFTRAVLVPASGARAWGVAYGAAWLAIVGWIVLYAGPAPMLGVVAVAWLVVHAAIVWLGTRLRAAAQRPLPPRSTIIENEEEEEEEEPPPPPPPTPPTAREKILGAVRSALGLAAVLLVLAIGENIAALRQLDAALAPFRGTLLLLLGLLAAAGFALFLGGIIAFVLRGGDSETERGIEDVHARRLGITRPPVQRDSEISLRELGAAWRDGTWRDRPRVKRFYVIGGGVALMLVAGAAFGIVAAPPGVKLLIMLTVAYVAVRFARASTRRPPL